MVSARAARTSGVELAAGAIQATTDTRTVHVCTTDTKTVHKTLHNKYVYMIQ